MAKDYKSRGRQQRSKGKKKPAATRQATTKKQSTSKQAKPTSGQRNGRLRWVLGLFVILVLLAGAFAYLQLTHKINSTQASVQDIPVVVAKPVQQVNTEQQILHPVQFSFVTRGGEEPAHTVFSLQLGTFPVGQALTNLEDQLQQAKIRYRKLKVVRLDQVLYRVQVGSYKQLKQAVAEQQSLQANKLASVIVQE